MLAHQHAEHPVAGLRALALDHVQQVGQRLRDRAERALDAAEEVEAGGGEALEVGAVLVRDAQQLADRQRRDRQGEALDEIHLPFLGGDPRHLVELARDDRVDAGREPAQAVSGELRREHLAQAGVLRRVREAEAPGVLLGGDARLADEVGEIAAERACRAEYGLGLVVAADQPAPDPEGQLQQAHRLAVAQLAHIGHGVEAGALERQQGLVGQQRQQRGRATPSALETHRQPRDELDDPLTHGSDSNGVRITTAVRHTNETPVSLVDRSVSSNLASHS